MIALLKKLATRERVLGLMQHAGTWFAGYLVSKGLIDGSYTPTIEGGVLGLSIIAWSAYSGGKETTVEIIYGVVRHLMTMGASIAIFKGWMSEEQANILISAVLGMIAATWSVTAPEKALAEIARLK